MDIPRQRRILNIGKMELYPGLEWRTYDKMVVSFQIPFNI